MNFNRFEIHRRTDSTVPEMRYMKQLLILVLSIASFMTTAFGQGDCRNVPSVDPNGLLVITRRLSGLTRSGFGYINRKGTIVVQPKYDDAYPFSGDRALVRSGDKYGFIDQKGVEVIKPQFDVACSFSEGLASVRINGKYGYIDKDGQTKILPMFSGAYNFSEGFARIKIMVAGDADEGPMEQYGYIDKNGRQLGGETLTFDAASDFHGGIALVIDPVFGLETYINSQGKIVERRSYAPERPLGIGPELVEIRFESAPVGANIYLIPNWRVRRDPSLTDADEKNLSEFQVPTGPTPTSFTAKQKRFVVLFVLQNIRKQKPLDVRPDSSKLVKVTFP